MKKLIVLFLVCIPLLSFSQHCILKTNGDSLIVKIDTIAGSTIVFHYMSGNLGYLELKDVKGYYRLPDNIKGNYVFQEPKGEVKKATIDKDSILNSPAKNSDLDNIKYELNVMRSQLHDIKLNLYNSHIEYRKGTALIIIGEIITLGATTYLSLDYKNIKDPTLPFGGAAFGGLLSLIGFGIQIDSHRHIGFAGGFQSPR